MSYFLDLALIGLSEGMVYALIALGVSFIYSGLDLVHFAHPEFYMVGAYVGFGCVMAGIPFPIAVILSMVATAALGMFVERVFYRRLTSVGGGLSVAGMSMIICGFGMSIVMQNFAFLLFGPMSRKLPTDFGRPLSLGEVTLPIGYLWIVVASVVLVAGLTTFLKYTRFGLAVRAVAYSKSSASLMGINVSLYISVIFGVACALAAAAGALGASVNFINAQMGFVIGLKAFSAAVIGGLGNLAGAIVGGLVLGLAEAIGSGYLSTDYKDIYPFIILVLVLFIRPDGIFGRSVKDKA